MCQSFFFPDGIEIARDVTRASRGVGDLCRPTQRFLQHGIVRRRLWCLDMSDLPAFLSINILFPADKAVIHGKNPCRDQMPCSRIGSRGNVDNAL
jgi:hypothetical protein